MKKIIFVMTLLFVSISCTGKGESNSINPDDYNVI